MNPMHIYQNSNFINFPNNPNNPNNIMMPNNPNNPNNVMMPNIPTNPNNVMMPNVSNLPNIPNIPNNSYIPSYQQLWNAFQNILMQQKMWQMYYMKLYYDYLRYCAKNNLNYQNLNSYSMYYQEKFGMKPAPPNQMSHSSQNNDTNNSVYINEKFKPLLPRPDQIENLNYEPVNQNMNNPDVMNMAFVTNAGYRVVLVLPKNTTILQMCNQYMDKIGLPRYYIGNDIQFLYNAKLINPFSEETIFHKFQTNVSITVFDQANVIGASLK
jgi:hypothetical protein